MDENSCETPYYTVLDTILTFLYAQLSLIRASRMFFV